MRVVPLKKSPTTYSCNAYHVRGDWNALDDVNTLIDVGTDDFILHEIETISTGLGKRRVEQVILTHEHFDHSGGLKFIKDKYNPVVYGYSMIPGVDIQIYDGMHIKIGDKDAVIMYTPGHSNDSVCVYCEEEGALFSGDTPLIIRSPGGSFVPKFVEILKKIETFDLKVIYPGHDDPIDKEPNEAIRYSLENIAKSKINL